MADKRKRAVRSENVEAKEKSLVEKRQSRQKEEILTILERNGGILYTAARSVGISSRTIERWRNTDTEFNERVLDILSNKMAFVEDKLMELINEGDFRAIRLYLICKGRHGGSVPSEGWVENPSVNVSVGVNNATTNVTNNIRTDLSDKDLLSVLKRVVEKDEVIDAEVVEVVEEED